MIIGFLGYKSTSYLKLIYTNVKSNKKPANDYIKKLQINIICISLERSDMRINKLVEEYMNAFYNEFDTDKLKSILSKNLTFEGPFYTFNSAEEYLNSLKENPPVGMSFKILQFYEKENSVSLLYEFSKERIKTLMAQFFTINDNKISEIKLVFDTGAFFCKD